MDFGTEIGGLEGGKLVKRITANLKVSDHQWRAEVFPPLRPCDRQPVGMF